MAASGGGGGKLYLVRSGTILGNIGAKLDPNTARFHNQELPNQTANIPLLAINSPAEPSFEDGHPIGLGPPQLVRHKPLELGQRGRVLALDHGPPVFELRVQRPQVHSDGSSNW
ncbi:unnamed protein product [Linum trigynum]|uniref:Uncharacterized protein n=1 Tax=Linum trigynum TaxID=586398 RepID=A0AAV2EV77_9ROSI